MNQKEILALISNIEKELAVLKSLVGTVESTNVSPEDIQEISVSANEDTLPDPPAEVIISEESILGCQIITSLPDFYTGRCSVLNIHKRYFDNGQPKLYIDKYHVVIEAYNAEMKLLGTITTHWDSLSRFHVDLIKRGINTHSKDVWMPKVVVLFLD